jgi:hypothetical protein
MGVGILEEADRWFIPLVLCAIVFFLWTFGIFCKEDDYNPYKTFSCPENTTCGVILINWCWATKVILWLLGILTVVAMFLSEYAPGAPADKGETK